MEKHVQQRVLNSRYQMIFPQGNNLVYQQLQHKPSKIGPL